MPLPADSLGCRLGSTPKLRYSVLSTERVLWRRACSDTLLRARRLSSGVAMIGIRTRVRGVHATIMRLQRAQARTHVGVARNAAWIRRRLIEATRKNFVSESDDGRPWQSLSPAYAARKKGPQILIETRAMFRSLVSRTARTIYRVAPNSLVWGTSDPKAKYHQHRDALSSSPSRPFMPRPGRIVGPLARRIRDFIVGTR